MPDDESAALLAQISTPAQLRELLSAPGVTDDLIEEFTARLGAVTVLDRVFELMGTRFLPEAAAGETGVLEWRVQAAGDSHVYTLTVSADGAVGRRGPAGRPRTTVTISLPMLMRLCAGELNPVTAVLTKKVRLSGDVMFGARAAKFFDYS